MKNIAALFCVALLLLGFGSCKNNPVGPDIEPGTRNYTWTHDTIKAPYTSLSQIWGDATDNLWAVGGSGDLDKTIFHYDGISWKRDPTWRNIKPRCIYGFDKNDIWIGGDGGEIWHYSSGAWERNIQYKISGFAFVDIKNIVGISKNDIYAVGVAYSSDLKIRRGFILHYNGINWSTLFLANSNSGYYLFLKENNQVSNYYLADIKQTDGMTTDTVAIYKYWDRQFKEIYRSLRTDNDDIYFNSINNRLLYSLGDGIYIYHNEQFFNLFKVSNPAIFTKGIFGRNEKDLFLTMTDGLAHYNGSNIEYIFKQTTVPVMLYGGMVILEKDIYLLENSIPGLNIIHHGKVNN